MLRVYVTSRKAALGASKNAITVTANPVPRAILLPPSSASSYVYVVNRHALLVCSCKMLPVYLFFFYLSITMFVLGCFTLASEWHPTAQMMLYVCVDLCDGCVSIYVYCMCIIGYIDTKLLHNTEKPAHRV